MEPIPIQNLNGDRAGVCRFWPELVLPEYPQRQSDEVHRKHNDGKQDIQRHEENDKRKNTKFRADHPAAVVFAWRYSERASRQCFMRFSPSVFKRAFSRTEYGGRVAGVLY